MSYNSIMTHFCKNGTNSSARHRLRIGRHGRVVIPAAVRRHLGLRPGDELVAWMEGDRLVLRPREAVEAELWEMFASEGGSLAEALIAERRREAERERGEG